MKGKNLTFETREKKDNKEKNSTYKKCLAGDGLMAIITETLWPVWSYLFFFFSSLFFVPTFFEQRFGKYPDLGNWNTGRWICPYDQALPPISLRVCLSRKASLEQPA
ncbi:hypothetical protein CEXT_616851 [Caerostris extrusa]|uniref:Uncharacterized protein n=1 Tax=Caerostris extrusa TaxID=172846 RepID=A0AAV4QPY4_CAEEX|nr:hypothetical protein CEXT_616851 [Caerostris extrusa]